MGDAAFILSSNCATLVLAQTCREKRQAPVESGDLLPVLSPGEQNAGRVTAMRPVGSYAYAVVFADGHDSGIYTFELLRELGVEKGE